MCDELSRGRLKSSSKCQADFAVMPESKREAANFVDKLWSIINTQARLLSTLLPRSRPMRGARLSNVVRAIDIIFHFRILLLLIDFGGPAQAKLFRQFGQFAASL